MLMGVADKGVALQTVDTTLQALGWPRRERSRPSRYDQVYNWKDVLERYSGQELELPATVLTAVLLNERARGLISIVAPAFATIYNEFTLSTAEAIMIPFDLIATGGIPRTTTLKRDTRSFSMDEYKRAQEITMQAFTDPVYGAQYMNEITTVLAQQAQLTLMKTISATAAWTPFEMKTRLLAGHADRLHCAKEIWQQVAGFASANAGPADFTRLVLQMHKSSVNPIDTVLIPEGFGTMLEKLTGESRSVPSYNIVYDEQTKRFINILYDGPRSIVSIQVADGAIMDFIENINFRTTADAPDAETFQSLRSFPLLGEVVPMPRQSRNAPASGDAQANDVWLHHQTETSITIEPVRFVDGLKACGVWNNVFGNGGDENLNEAAFLNLPEPGDLLKKMIGEINKNPARLQAALEYFDAWDGRDNNTPNPSKTAGKLLQQMDSFREYHPFIARNAAGDEVEFPAIVGRMENRMLPNEYIERAARAIIDIGCEKLKLNKAYLQSIASWGVVGGAPATPNAVAGLSELARLLTEYIPKHGLGGIARLEGLVFGRRTARGSPPAPPAYYRGAITLNATAAHRTVVDFIAAHPLQELTQLEKLNGESQWVQALAAVPSTEAALKDFLTFAYGVQQQLAAATTDDQRGAINAATNHVFAELKNHAGKATVLDALKKAADHVSKSAVIELQDKLLVNARQAQAGALKAPLGAAETKFAALDAKASDAMDVDAPALSATLIERFAAHLGAIDITAVAAGRYADVRFDYLQTVDDLTAIVMLALESADNSPFTHIVLAQKLGVSLFRLNYWRPFQRYRMLSVAGLIGGGQTYKTAINHAFTNVASAGIEGYLQIVATFRMRVLPVNPKTTDILVNVIANGIVGSINTHICRSQQEAHSDELVKPSILAAPVPIDEDKYSYPLHMTNLDVYSQGEHNGNIPLFKHSSAAYFELFLGKSWLSTQQGYTDNSHFASEPAYVSLVGWLGASWHRGIGGVAMAQGGIGPRGECRFNVPSAAAAWAGHGSKFPLNALEVAMVS